jgi:hypothetical protein
MYDGIHARISRANNESATQLAELGADHIGPPLTHYVNSLLDRIVQGSIKLWLPLASRFIDTEVKRAVTGIPPRQSRLQILVRLDVPGRDGSVDLGASLERWARGEQSIDWIFSLDAASEIGGQRDIVFAVASTLALALGAWSSADRFADLARRAQQDRKRVLSRTADWPYELNYLHAVAKRFRIGEIGPPSNYGSYLALQKYRSLATDMLGTCITYHGGKGGGRERQPLRQIRAVSERASVNVFFSAAALSAGGTLRGRVSDEATAALGRAEADVLECLDLEKDIDAISKDNQRRAQFFRRLQRQVTANAAACVVIRRGLLGDERPTALWTPAIAGRATSLLEREKDTLPEIVHSDVLILLYLLGHAEKPERAFMSSLRNRARISKALALDRTRLEKTHHWLSTESR